MTDVCKPTDLIRAVVESEPPPLTRLTSAGRGLGVIKAYCSKCGGYLQKNGRGLRCVNCLNVERRRTAPDYGKL